MSNSTEAQYSIGVGMGGGGGAGEAGAPQIAKLPINEAQIASLFEHPFTSAPPSCIIFLRHCIELSIKSYTV